MKKIAILGASLVFAALPVAGVFADEPTGLAVVDSSEHNVVLGSDVDTTVYDVDIVWGDMEYGWKYNSTTGKYEFRSKVGCAPVVDGAAASSFLKDHGNLYSDSNCTTLQTGELVGNTIYYLKFAKSGEIQVIDNTVNGAVDAAASFTPAANYEWVVGKFGAPSKSLISYNNADFYVNDSYNAADGSFSYTEFGYGNVYGTSLHEAPGNRLYAYLYLEVDDTVAGSHNASANDVIGTVTVTVSPR